MSTHIIVMSDFGKTLITLGFEVSDTVYTRVESLQDWLGDV